MGLRDQGPQVGARAWAGTPGSQASVYTPLGLVLFISSRLLLSSGCTLPVVYGMSFLPSAMAGALGAVKYTWLPRGAGIVLGRGARQLVT